MRRVCVYTAIFDGYDPLRSVPEPLAKQTEDVLMAIDAARFSHEQTAPQGLVERAEDVVRQLGRISPAKAG